MIAMFVFTTAESKKLIAKAIAGMDRVKKAFNDGILAIHPSSSTYFLVEELTGSPPQGKVWVTGVITPRGFCGEANLQVKKIDSETGIIKALEDPGKYPHTIVIKKGQVVAGLILSDLMSEMKGGDIYFKGVNAVDSNKRVGVLRGSMVEGTIGRVVSVAASKGFEVICPVGFEKLLPVNVDEAAEMVRGPKKYSMGIKINLFPFDATVVNEVDSLQMLTGVKAVPFAAGGLAGAEGGVSVAVTGSSEEVDAAIELAESVKGATLPQVQLPDCSDCGMHLCHFIGQKRHWF